MRFRDHFKMALRSLVAKKMRAMLTMLGIIIGVASVIALISIGQAATGTVTSQVKSLGSNLITITPNRANGAVFKKADVPWLLQTVPQIASAAPLLTGQVQSAWNNHTWTTTLTGTDTAMFAIQDRKVTVGRYFNALDVQMARHVAILGTTTAEKLFPQGVQPVGKTISVNGTPFQVIGILKKKGGGFGPNPDDTVIAPITTASFVLHTTDLSAIDATATSAQVAPLATGHIEAVMDHKFHHNNSVTVLSQDQLLSTLSTVTTTLTLMLGGIAGISLLVGGIGIMNIMLVTVSERTREIGLRKALGAPNNAILGQFLVEAAFLTLVGGSIGALLGTGGAAAVSRLAGWSTTVQFQSVLLAMGFSVVIGLVFGLWPALQASRLDPIEALRRE